MYLSIYLSVCLSMHIHIDIHIHTHKHTHTHTHTHSNGAALDSYTQHYQVLLGGGHTQRGGAHASFRAHVPGGPASPPNVPAGFAGVPSGDVTAGSSSPDACVGGVVTDSAAGLATGFTSQLNW